MSLIVSRTYTEISPVSPRSTRQQDGEARLLEAFREVPAYVLLGAPGAGKTTAFAAECEILGEQACLVTARDFVTFGSQKQAEWHGKILFIDGLDEVRVGSSDPREPFDQIRKNLDALENPWFRLSCRTAGWLGANDRNHLETVSQQGTKLTILRLNPLTRLDIEQLLQIHPDVDDAEAFIREANRRGIGELLLNPQTLNLLAKAVAGGSWPEGRKETFEMACHQMVSEQNEEHLAASKSSSPCEPGQLLDAAGYLCAVQLLSGVAGYTVRPGKSDNKYPLLDQCGGYPVNILCLALATILFKGISENCFAPVHRHIGEFLGARYLAQVIDDKSHSLSARRVIALLTEKEGSVVTELRGLSAWLAAQCPEAGAVLVERDPVGVGLYGDVRGLLPDQRRELLASLEREGSRLESWSSVDRKSRPIHFQKTSEAFGALARRDMESQLKRILKGNKRDSEHQVFTDFVLCFLRQGDPLASLSKILLEIVCDGTRWPRVRESALRAFLHNCPDNQKKNDALRKLLNDIQTQSMSDADGTLPRILVAELYPDGMTTSELWSYLSERKSLNLSKGPWWLTIIINKSSDEQVAQHLDNLQKWFPYLRTELKLHPVGHRSLQLLVRGLKAHGDKSSTVRLYDWLCVGVDWYWQEIGEEYIQEIRSWLEQRPNVLQALILEGLNRCPDSDEFRLHAGNVFKQLYGVSLPRGFGRWALEQAVATAKAKPRIGEYLFEMAFYQLDKGCLSLDILRERTQKNDRLKTCLNRLLESRLQPEPVWTSAREQRQEEEKLLVEVRLNEAALRENRAEPNLLHDLARLYLEHDSVDKRLEAVEEALRGDRHLTQVVLECFRGTVDRQDLPTYDEALASLEMHCTLSFAWPFLAGLAEIQRTDPEDDAGRWSDTRIRKAMVFYWAYSPISEVHVEPEWYRRLLVTRPELLAELQVQIAALEVHDGHEIAGKFWKLAHDRGHAEVAKHASLPLLRTLAIQFTLPQSDSLDSLRTAIQLDALNYLLWAAIQYADRTALLELVERKTSQTCMDDVQRARWLAAGLVIAPEVYEASLSELIQDDKDRFKHWGDFFYEHNLPPRWLDTLGVPELKRFIRLFTRLLGKPAEFEKTEKPDMFAYEFHVDNIQDLVKSLIRRLSMYPCGEAGEALGLLCKDESLSHWQDTLIRARDDHRVVHRDANYRYPSIGQICQTLEDGGPTNPADLAALVMDHLGELADKIRYGNTNDWRQYWNLDGNSNLLRPRNENSCRDALLSDLQQRLREQGVNASPEGHYANDARADICVSYGNFQVPVEVKQNKHRDLWRALHDQLIKRYTIDPGAEGYGIYLVFWFGEMDVKYTRPPRGKLPANAEQLAKRLQATLSRDEVKKIAVCVIDVSKPNGT